jgi:hypothetical protein
VHAFHFIPENFFFAGIPFQKTWSEYIWFYRFFSPIPEKHGMDCGLKTSFFQNEVNYFKLRTYSFGSGCHDHRSPSTVVLVGDKQIVA